MAEHRTGSPSSIANTAMKWKTIMQLRAYCSAMAMLLVLLLGVLATAYGVDDFEFDDSLFDSSIQGLADTSQTHSGIETDEFDWDLFAENLDSPHDLQEPATSSDVSSTYEHIPGEIPSLRSQGPAPQVHPATKLKTFKSAGVGKLRPSISSVVAKKIGKTRKDTPHQRDPARASGSGKKRGGYHKPNGDPNVVNLEWSLENQVGLRENTPKRFTDEEKKLLRSFPQSLTRGDLMSTWVQEGTKLVLQNQPIFQRDPAKLWGAYKYPKHTPPSDSSKELLSTPVIPKPRPEVPVQSKTIQSQVQGLPISLAKKMTPDEQRLFQDYSGDATMHAFEEYWVKEGTQRRAEEQQDISLRSRLFMRTLLESRFPRRVITY